MPFNVELPDNLGSTTQNAPAPEVDTAPAGEPQSLEGQDSTRAESPEAPRDILDLDKLDRFRFDGKEWSAKDLRNSYLMHQDYTRKTQEVAETRKYVDNFQTDLQTVINDPTRIKDFKAVYPKAYVSVAEKILERLAPQNPSVPQVNPNTQKMPDELSRKLAEMESKLSKLDQWEEQQRVAEVQKIESWLDNQYSTLSKKYDHADPEVVTARAQVLSDNGHKVDEKILEKLFEKHHSEVKTRWDKTYKEKVNKQLEAGNKSKDVGAGGGTPGGAPKQARTIKEATKIALEDLGAR